MRTLLSVLAVKRSMMGRSTLIILVLAIALGSWGCENPDRFKVPKYHRKKQIVFEYLYQVKDPRKLKMPRLFPLWTEFTESDTMRLFRPEPVWFEGVRWYRESTSAVHVFYFRKNNHLAMGELLKEADSVAKFINFWFDKPFSAPIQVLLVPEPDPSDPEAKPVKKRLKLPQVASPRLTIYTGDDMNPYLSKYGNVGVLIEKSIRIMMNGSEEVDRKHFWRTVIIPAYFRLRATGAMVDKSYNHTSLPRFSALLRESGRPTIEELNRLIERYRRGLLPYPLQKRSRLLISSFLGFIADGYGQGVLALILRHLIKHPKATFEQATEKIIGYPIGKIWKNWEDFYYGDIWRLVIEGKVW